MEHKTKIEKNTENPQASGDDDPVAVAMALRHAYIDVDREPPSFTIDETNVDSLIADLELEKTKHSINVLAQYAIELPGYRKFDLIDEQSRQRVASDYADIQARYAQERSIAARERWRKVFGVATRIAGVLSPRVRTS